MPVTTEPSPYRVGKNQDRTVDVTDESLGRRVFDIVTEGCHSPYENDPRRPKRPFRRRGSAFNNLPLIASSFDNKSGTGTEATQGFITPYTNGFVDGLIRAFNQDLHLVVRPDDVWQAIVSQFSLFVNGHAERLRHLFVSHEGRRILTVDLTPFSLANIDLGKVALEFASSIQANVLDAELRQWMLPGFSTTTDHDKAVAAFGMMGALQKYFEYHLLCGCGLPSVTLLGERADWAELARRVEKLPQYGEECARWADLLRPVMRHMLLTFDMPESQEVKDFWLRAAHEAGIEGSGQGIRTLSGWITAFAYFQEDGNVTEDYDEEYLRTVTWPPYDGESPPHDGSSPPVEERKRLILDEVSYPLMGRRRVPRSVVVLPMLIRDFGAGLDRFTTVIAGSVGTHVSADSTTSQPVSAWWVVQEFEDAIKAKDQLKPGSSVAGSTTEGNSEASSELKNSEDSNEEDSDVGFEHALP